MPSHPEPLTPDDDREYGTVVTLLGTAGGPPWWEGTERQGISTLLTVNGAQYLIDCGEGWTRSFRRSGQGVAGFEHGIDNFRAVFLTHQHSDHTVDLPNLLLLAWHNGSRALDAPIRIIGPGDRGSLPPIFGEPEVEPEVWNPSSPTPGTRESVDRLLQAYATDINDRMRDNAKQDLREIFEVSDIELPESIVTRANVDPAPGMDPIEIYADENVRVSAILVDHRPIFPAYAFRFDTADGSVVISGDTGVCANLVKISEGADILLHECLDMAWIDSMMGPQTQNFDPFLRQHMVAAHTSIEQVGLQAERAGVGTLVLTHLVPANAPDELFEAAAADFPSGRLIVGHDLMRFGLRAEVPVVGRS
ncbi:MBL fold metallo-hydrolase [Epidermidibacterium keratini]|uniref:MBL fold metallo-hydrolase n=1 Tax=Epidermidibacterium keratini TaxID=1891644 RepID=A0A7L4YR17_9ACTN|nr:MBL fold metallo-hydrolase [Epidermidibacterium keratini]QHC01383.1 MBL fold metallo-hydrolase [Epidermidibacterium keratini]